MKIGKPSRAKRGEATRARILSAARQRFASDGYERATIRAIAADAGIDPSLVMRYFTNKQGLFVAAADIDLRLPELRGVPREMVGVVLVEHFLDRWQEDDILQALLRTAATNKRAAERMRTIWSTQPGPTLAAAGAKSKPATRAALINGLFLGFAYARFILELPPLVKMGHAETVKWLAPIVQRYLYDTP
ncbi:MAG: TetR family transcriptional regulator [Rhodanobacteraceae bacterium]